jgi:DNA-binding NarL/FixJ family response regulator
MHNGVMEIEARDGSGRTGVTVREPERLLERCMAAAGLSKREQEVAALAIRGCSNRQIADRLFVCEQTIKDHLHAIFTKLGIHRRGQLAAALYERAMAEPVWPGALAS